MPLRDVPSAQERFRGWLIRSIRPSWPNVRLELHSTKRPFGAHLHGQRWRLWFDQSTSQGRVFGFTSQQGVQRFHFQGAAHLLRRLRDTLFPFPDDNVLVEDPKWASHDNEEPPHGDARPPLLPFVPCP